MSTYEYNPILVGHQPPSPTTTTAAAAASRGEGGGGTSTTTDEEANKLIKTLSRLLAMTPFFRVLIVMPIRKMIQIFPASATIIFTIMNPIVLTSATQWRRFMMYRPLRLSVPLLNDITIAHMMLSFPLLLWLIQSTDLAFLRPTSHHSLKHSGKMTSYVMTITFLTSNKSNSLVSLVTGLSFDRLINNIHLISALVTLWMSLLHGIQIAYWNRGDNKTHHHHDHDDHHHDDHHDHDHDEEDHPSNYVGDGGRKHYYYHRLLHHDSIHAYLGPDPNIWKFVWDGKRNSSGFVVLLALLALITTSIFHRLLRKWWYECWFIQHIVAAIIVLIAGMIHGADAFWFVIIWWIVDLVIRYVTPVMMGGSKRNNNIVGGSPRTATITRVAENVTKIQLEKGDFFHYEAGQFVKVAIPSIRPLEFHPFSIASAPHNNNESHFVTLYVRALPDNKAWTRNLYNMAATNNNNASLLSPSKDSSSSSSNSNNVMEQQQQQQQQSVNIWLEGPYGSVPPIIERPDVYSMAVFISGGIGVTPCLSIVNSLIIDNNKQRGAARRQQPTTTTTSSALQKIRYIWSIRDEVLIQAIPPPTLLESDNDDDTSSHNNNSSNNDDNGIELVEERFGFEEGRHHQSAGEPSSPDHMEEEHRRPPSTLMLQNDIYVTQASKFLDHHHDHDQNGKDNDDVEAFEESTTKKTTTPSINNNPYTTIHRERRRFNVSAVIAQIHTEALREGWGRVFVMGCGPVSLMEELEVACRQNQSTKVHIDYHQEIFDY